MASHLEVTKIIFPSIHSWILHEQKFGKINLKILDKSGIQIKKGSFGLQTRIHFKF